MGQTSSVKSVSVKTLNSSLKMKNAVFGLGCFWHSDAIFGCQKGVYKTSVGYTGGTLENPTYRNLADHTEVVHVQFDPDVTSYEHLLQLFWKNHDPSERHKRQYRSVIFYSDEEQKSLASESKKELESKMGHPVVTDIEPLVTYYYAEDYHQKYFLQTHHTKLFKSLGINGRDELMDSEVAAKLNGYVVGLNSMESFNAISKSLGLSAENIAYVQAQIAKGKQSHC